MSQIKRRNLSKEKIREKAMEIILDKGSVEKLSMRMLAKELSVEVPALYWHYKNKNDLTADLIEYVFSLIPTEEEITCRKDFEAFALCYRKIVENHFFIIDLITDSNFLIGQNQLNVIKYLKVSMVHIGIKEKDAYEATINFHSYLFGNLLSTSFDLSLKKSLLKQADSSTFDFPDTQNSENLFSQGLSAWLDGILK